jgi:hypothetical protein
MPIRDIRVRARFDLVARVFECFLLRAETCLGNFVVPAGLRVRQFTCVSILAFLSRSLQLKSLLLVRCDGGVGAQHQSVQSVFIEWGLKLSHNSSHGP